MTTYFTDTSALAKRYISEVGSSWMRGLTRASLHNTIIVSAILPIEFYSLINRLLRAKRITPVFARNTRDLFLRHYRTQYITVQIQEKITIAARKLTIRHPLRTLDSIQLACAIQARQDTGASITFLSADTDLLAAAAVEGFAVDNPLLHP